MYQKQARYFIEHILDLDQVELSYTVHVDGSFEILGVKNVCFGPLTPERKSGHMLAWKKTAFSTQQPIISGHLFKTAKQFHTPTVRSRI